MVLLWHCCKTNLYFWECCWAVCPRRWHCGKGRSSGALLKENKHSQRTLLFDLALFFSFSNVLLLSHWCFRMFCGGVASSCEVKGALWGEKNALYGLKKAPLQHCHCLYAKQSSYQHVSLLMGSVEMSKLSFIISERLMIKVCLTERCSTRSQSTFIAHDGEKERMWSAESERMGDEKKEE